MQSQVSSTAKQAAEARVIAQTNEKIRRLTDELEAQISIKPGTLKTKQLEDELAEAIARKRQPTGILTDEDIGRARAVIPETRGLLDATGLLGLGTTPAQGLESLRQTLGVTPGQPGQPPIAAGGASSRTDDDILRQYGVTQ